MFKNDAKNKDMNVLQEPYLYGNDKDEANNGLQYTLGELSSTDAVMELENSQNKPISLSVGNATETKFSDKLDNKENGGNKNMYHDSYDGGFLGKTSHSEENPEMSALLGNRNNDEITQSLYSDLSGGKEIPESDVTTPKSKNVPNVTESVSLDWSVTPVTKGISNIKYMSYTEASGVPENSKEQNKSTVTSLEDALEEFYNGELKSLFESNMEDARKRGGEVLEDEIPNAVDNPMRVYAKVAEEEDPVTVIDKTIASIDDAKLREFIEPLAISGGVDVDDYIDSFVKPTLYNKLLDEYVKMTIPDNSGEYIARSAFENSFLGKFISLLYGRRAGLGNRIALEAQGLAAYNASRIEGFAAGVGSLFIDAPLFSKLSFVSSSVAAYAGNRYTSMLGKRLIDRILCGSFSPRMDKVMASRIAERVIKQSLKYKVASGALSQGLTLGNYDIANSIVDDLLYGDGVDMSKGAASFGKGFLIGSAAAAVSGPLRVLARNARGARRLFYSAGVISSESAVFTAATEIGKLANGVDVEPVDLFYDYAESSATILSMRLTNWSPKGREIKLDRNGKLKKEFNFSLAEVNEIEEAGVNANNLVKAIEKELNIPYLGGSKNAARIKGIYAHLMSNKGLSASTRAKLMLLVENKVTSTPPVPYDYMVEQVTDKVYRVTLFDYEGNCIEKKHYDSLDGAKSYMFLLQGKLRKNRIESYERELTTGIQSQNFFRHANEYLTEKGIDINELVDAMYNKSHGEPMTSRHQMIVNDILMRSSYDISGMSNFLQNERRRIEREFGIDENSIHHIMNTPHYMLDNRQLKAINEYERVLAGEVESLKKGTDPVKAGKIAAQGGNGEDNTSIVRSEMENYQTSMVERDNRGTRVMNYRPLTPENVYKEPKRGVVWNKYGYEFTPELMESYKNFVKDFSKKLGVEINVITDEREIKRPDPNNQREVEEYNAQVSALGWTVNGKIYINFPNCGSMDILERTIVHETVGHAGLDKLFGHHLQDFLEDVYKNADDKLLLDIRRMKELYRHADNYTVIEEYIADLTEKTWMSSKDIDLLQRFKDFISVTLNKLNIYNGKKHKLTSEELGNILRLHCRYVQKKNSVSKHRIGVFGRFETSRLPEIQYYNYDAYLNDVYTRIEQGKFFESTPGFLIGYKTLLNYDRLPEDVRKQFRESVKMSDEQIMNELRNVRPVNEDAVINENGKENTVPLDDAKPSARSTESSKAYSMSLGNGTSLGEIIDEPSLFAMHPYLSAIPLDIVDGSMAKPRYDSKEKKITLGGALLTSEIKDGIFLSAMRDAVDDYTNHNAAVSRNYMDFREKIKREYDSALHDLGVVDRIRYSSNAFVDNPIADNAFVDKHGLSSSEFRERFPSFDEYLFHRLAGNIPLAITGGVEHRGPGNIKSEKSGVSLFDLESRFSGPMDILRRHTSPALTDGTRLERVENRIKSAGLSLDEKSELEDELETYAMYLIGLFKQYGRGAVGNGVKFPDISSARRYV